MVKSPLGTPAIALGTLALVTLAGGWAAPTSAQDSVPATTATCPSPVLSRLTQHRVAPGETLETIAQQYNLLSTTLMGFNPASQQGQVTVGQTLTIPPYNGIRVTVSPGQTWADVAQAYSSRADVLFEVNGCVSTVPNTVFVPGVNWFPGVPTATTAASTQRAENPSPLQGYPLPSPTTVILNYGWQPDASRNDVVFNTGVGLASAPATPVLVVGPGTVAFAGDDPVYGQLVVVNHAQGLQTRYANLAQVNVAVGQSVGQGEAIGQVATMETADSSILFFEVRLNSPQGWVAQNPQEFVPALAQR
jgi:murein DD-endopeptidase MepM/ murein hydrolase activator NlpD